MGKRNNNATAKDVAQAAGVSQSTVSMILNNYQNVSFSEETRQRVLAACISTGYRGVSLANATPTEKILLVVCPSCSAKIFGAGIHLFYSGHVPGTRHREFHPPLSEDHAICWRHIPVSAAKCLSFVSNQPDLSDRDRV